MKLLTSLTPPRTATSKYFEKRPLPGSPSSDPRGVTGGRLGGERGGEQRLSRRWSPSGGVGLFISVHSGILWRRRRRRRRRERDAREEARHKHKHAHTHVHTYSQQRGTLTSCIHRIRHIHHTGCTPCAIVPRTMRARPLARARASALSPSARHDA